MKDSMTRAAFTTPLGAVSITAGVSLALLLGALGFQHIGGLAPCELCLTQRVPHRVVIGLGVVALALLAVRQVRFIPALLLLMALGLSVSAGIGAYHAGVEWKWWQGPSACSSGLNADASLDDLLSQLQASQVVSCTDIPWSLFGISMAGYNFLISSAAALFALWAALRIVRHDKTQ